MAKPAPAHHRRGLYSADWRENAGRNRTPDRSMDATIEPTFDGVREAEAARRRGEEPQSCYRWVSVYQVNGEGSAGGPVLVRRRAE